MPQLSAKEQNSRGSNMWHQCAVNKTYVFLLRRRSKGFSRKDLTNVAKIGA